MYVQQSQDHLTLSYRIELWTFLYPLYHTKFNVRVEKHANMMKMFFFSQLEHFNFQFQLCHSSFFD